MRNAVPGITLEDPGWEGSAPVCYGLAGERATRWMEYFVAAALSIIILSKNRYGEVGWLDLMKGEVITIDNFDLALTAITLALVLTVLGLFHKEILFVSFDRAMAATLGKSIVFWDIVLYLLIGLTVSMAVLSVGPLIAFGFLLIPALTSHLFARTMRQFTIVASLLGGASSFVGFWLAYRYRFGTAAPNSG